MFYMELYEALNIDTRLNFLRRGRNGHTDQVRVLATANAGLIYDVKHREPEVDEDKEGELYEN